MVLIVIAVCEMQVEDLRNDFPVIDRYLEGQLLPVEVASFLERVGMMIKSYSPPQSSRKKDQAGQGQDSNVRSKNPRKRGKPSFFQDPSSPPNSRADRFPAVLIPYQDSKCDMVLDGTVPLLDGAEEFKEQGVMDLWQNSHLTTPSCSSLDSSSPESRKRRQQDRDEIRLPRDTENLRRSGRLCVQLKMFKHRDGVGAEATNPIFL